MGLAIIVGVLEDQRERDSESYEFYLEQFEKINQLLRAEKLREHHEPTNLGDAVPLFYEMYGYSGLHCLRRIAAYDWAGEGLPPPGNQNTLKEPPVVKYYQELDSQLSSQHKPRIPVAYEHLMMHSDAEGFYLPLEFPLILTAPRQLNLLGGIVGSSYRLIEECRQLAALLELPLDLDPDSEQVWDACEAQGEGGDTKWEEYGVEAFTCLRLFNACKFSIEHGAAITFV